MWKAGVEPQIKNCLVIFLRRESLKKHDYRAVFLRKDIISPFLFPVRWQGN
ncbi:MAG: hypothetical protein ACJAT4_002995 [Granulosicoccus sp.]|jgi:hypothetical protein